MRHFILTYLLILSCATAFGQSKAPICQTSDKDEQVMLTDCERIQCLYENKKYLQAYNFMLNAKVKTCTKPGQAIALIRTCTANNKFEAALDLLNNFKEELLSEEQYEKEKKHLLRIKGLAEIQSGAYLRNKVKRNTAYNDLVAFDFHDTLVQVYDKTDTLRYFPRIETIEGRFQFVNDSQAARFLDKKYLSWNNFSSFNAGTVIEDSLILLSAIKNRPYSGKNGAGVFEIICIDPKTKKEVKKRAFSPKKAGAAHPAIADSLLIFTSNMEGGYGGMDLYSAQITTDGYGAITNLGPEINSAANEIYPTVIGDTLYYSSNRTDKGFGGLDIYKVAVSGGDPQNAGIPINTAYDDFGAMSDGKTVKYMISNRAGGTGGTDIYTIHWAPTRLFFKQLKGRIDAGDLDLSATIIEIRSADGTIAQETTVEADGSFTLPNVKGMETYEISVLEGSLPDGSTLELYGEEGNVIKEVTVNENGGFKFELLSPQDYFIEKMANTDESVLSVDILGMLDSEEKEDGFKIYLQDSEGETVGVATTDAEGNFAFKSVKPDANYVIKSEVKDPNATIRIVDKSGKTISSIKPKNGGDFAYVRLSADERIITLTNEAEQKVKVGERELFDIPVLYFKIDDTRLNTLSRETLDRVAVLLEKNPDISLELSGHTDSRGRSAYNLQLSQDRIDAVIDYLVLKGTSRDRLTGKGYGETRLLNDCKDGVKCTEAEHAINRRTEIRIFQNNEP